MSAEPLPCGVAGAPGAGSVAFLASGRGLPAGTNLAPGTGTQTSTAPEGGSHGASTAALRAGGAAVGLALCSSLARQAQRSRRGPVRASAGGGFVVGLAGSHGQRRQSSSAESRGLVPRSVFDRFREDTITAIYTAQEEAIRQGQGTVRTEFILLGIVAKEQKGTGNQPAKDALASVGVMPDELQKKAIEVSLKRPPAAPSGGGSSLPFSDNAKKLFDIANSDTKEGEVGSEQLLKAMAKPELSGCGAAQALAELGVTGEKLTSALEADPGGPDKQLATAGAAGGDDKKLKLDEVAMNLTQMAKDGELDPVIGREEELQRLIQILLRRRKSNACLVGPAGVGKTAVAEGFAQMVVNDEVPARLRGKEVYSLDLGLLVGGTKYRGEFEERLKSVIDEVMSDERDIVLFIDEIHQLVGAGQAGGESAMDAANLLKPALARGDIQVIGATTLNEYVKFIEKDSALERRFQKVVCAEPTTQQTIKVLEGLRSAYEEHHNVLVSPEAISAAARLSHRYLPDRFLPDKAIDLVDEAGSLAQLRAGDDGDSVDAAKKQLVTASDVASVLSRWSGVPVERLTEDQMGRLMGLEGALTKRVIGQDTAVNAIARAVRRAKAGMSGPRRPVASLMFAGPTGVGKSELCKVLASEYYSDPKALVQIDMSEYQESHSVSRLVGPPPGYVGYEDANSGQLTEAVRRKPYSVVVLDEIEKAHGEVHNLLLQLLEEGRLTDSKGRVVNFSNCIVIMTSNVGSREILGSNKDDDGSMRAAVQAQLQKKFRPEFLNRIDELIIFRTLMEESLRQIAQLSLATSAQQAGVAHQEAKFLLEDSSSSQSGSLKFDWTVALEDEILRQGSNPTYGARPLRRAVQRCFEDPLAELLVSGAFSCEPPADGLARVDFDDGKVVVRYGSETLTPELSVHDEVGGAVDLSGRKADLEARVSLPEADASPAVAVS